jgi:hypothetical protein
VHLSNQFVEALISLKIKKIAVFRAAPFAKRAAFCLTPSCAGWRILPHGGRKTRLEIEFANDKAVQVYDGANGWKLRPFLGRRVVEPLSADEMKATSMESDLDGPLVDYSTSMIGLCQEGKSSPDALGRSAGVNSFRFFSACVGLSAVVPISYRTRLP